jgi:hypothetical protein
MSRIATLTAALTMALAPAAFAGPADYRAPDSHTAERAAQTQVYAGQDLRSPDAREVFVPSSGVVKIEPGSKPEPSSPDISTWGIVGILTAALAAGGLLAAMLRRHRQAGRPLSV